MLGLVDGIPALAGGGFAVTAGLQLWTMGKLERLNRIESDLGHRRHGNMHHTPQVE
jgi:hypothetical protein